MAASTRPHARIHRIAAHVALVTNSYSIATAGLSRLSPLRFAPGRQQALRAPRASAFSSSSAAAAVVPDLIPQVGSKATEAATPALLVVKERLEKNLRVVHDDLPSHVLVRPHAKAHKSPVIGKMQLAAGACGLCAAKLFEAEVLVAGGCLDVCITNEIIGRPNLERLARLAQTPGARISACVDSKENVDEMAEVMRQFGISNFEVLVEVNVGQNRCGVEPGEPAVALAQRVASHSPYLKFHGLHAYHGSNQHVRQPKGRQSTVEGFASQVRETVAGLHKAGLKCDIVTGGGTGSYDFEAKSGVYNEVQPGSYIFMDVDYSKNLQTSDLLPGPGPFSPSLFVLTTVVSVSTKGWAVVDAGMKALSLDSGAPRVFSLDLKAEDGVEYLCGGDEHGILKPAKEGGPMPYKVGDLLLLQPGHCDPTVNLYDHLALVDQSAGDWIVKEVVPISGRGPGL